MNVTIRDIAAISSIRPLEVTAYLRSKGWVAIDDQPTVSSWILKIDGETAEANVPLDTTLRDYALRMSEVLDLLSKIEDRSQTSVYSDLLTTYADVIRIRIEDADLKDGSLPIEVHAQIAQKARDLVLAAACSATEKRMVWHKRKPAQAIDQVRKVRIGQSERGSYVMSIISRVSPELSNPGQGKLFETEPPFERRVIQTLATSLEELDKAAAKAAINGSMESFQNAVAGGVSANLCEAVAGFWDDSDTDRKVEFNFSWSPARQIEANVPSKIRFTGDRVMLIREAARVMKEQSPTEDFFLEGAVVKLERTDASKPGKVTVIGVAEGRTRPILFELGDPHYSLAVKAHDQQLPFHCIGTLIREGRGYALREPREITVQEEN